MPSILFVHGTGTRELDYAPALQKIQRQLPKFRILPCLWGDTVGARLHMRGQSIPEYEDLAPGAAPASDEVERARWALLYQDPLFELRLLEEHEGERENLPPSATQPGKRAVELARALRTPEGFLADLRLLGIDGLWPAAMASVVEDPAFAELLVRANLDPLDTTRSIARALVAALLGAAELKGYPALAAATRDSLVTALVEPLGGQPLGVLEWGLGLLARYGTRSMQRHRRGLFDDHSAKIADILHYQARGQAIRDCIRRRIEETYCESGGPIVLLCHSLGGVAAVDLLIEHPLNECVSHLVTVGSQAGFFYEVDALVRLPYPEPLPEHFPGAWLNVYDRADFLSYRVGGIFPGRCTDLRVDNGQPFTQAHTAYWDNRVVIEEIVKFVGTG